MSRYCWILDNGHGENTPGKRSPELPDGGRLYEYDYNREIVGYIVEMLKELDICCVNLVPGLYDMPLRDRVRRANDIHVGVPRILVSVHGNAHGMGDRWMPGNGVETFSHPNSKKGKLIASVFQRNLALRTHLNDRGIKTAQFTIISDTDMPAVLTENGFFTHKEEVQLMLTQKFRRVVAQAHVDAIRWIEGDLTKDYSDSM